MSDTLYFTTEMPTENFDDLSPDPTIILERQQQNGNSDRQHSDSAVFLNEKEELECRVALLEVAFQNYALEIRDRMSKRLEELEEKLALQNSELRDVLREERMERKVALQDLSASVANAIDRVEMTALEGRKE